MAIYLDYDGIKGNVTAEGYKGMIALRHFKFGVFRKISMKPGELSNRECTRPTFNTVAIEKYMDAATSGLFRESVAGSEGKQAVIHFVRTGNNKLIEYMTYTLENCLISDYLIYDTNFNIVPHEKIQLSYSSLLISNTVRGANNRTQDTVRYGYDLAKAGSV